MARKAIFPALKLPASPARLVHVHPPSTGNLPLDGNEAGQSASCDTTRRLLKSPYAISQTLRMTGSYGPALVSPSRMPLASNHPR